MFVSSELRWLSLHVSSTVLANLAKRLANADAQYASGSEIIFTISELYSLYSHLRLQTTSIDFGNMHPQVRQMLASISPIRRLNNHTQDSNRSSCIILAVHGNKFNFIRRTQQDVFNKFFWIIHREAAHYTCVP